MSTLKALRVKVEAALKAASPGPWTIFATRGGHYGVKDPRGRMVVYAEAGLDGYGNGSKLADAEFIKVARTAVPEMLDEIGRPTRRERAAKRRSGRTLCLARR